MTHQASVRRDQPYWWVGAPLAESIASELPRAADVAIIGAGYTGLSCAISLARAGRSVVVIDKQRPGEGASTRNGGITSGNLRLGYSELSRRYGKERADGILLEAKAAREDLYRFIEDEKIDCDFQQTGRFLGALSANQYESSARECDYLAKSLGIEAYPVPEHETSKFIGTRLYKGGSVRMDVGGVHPGKLYAEMLRIATSAGVIVIAETTVLKIERHGPFVVHTEKGNISARHVASGTNAYADNLDPWLQRRIVPVRSRIIVTEPISTDMMDRLIPSRMMISDKRKLTYYFRPTPDGTRILFGGRDGTFAGDPAWPTEHLKTEMARIFPELTDVGIDHSWYGYVAMHRDMLPRIFEHEGIHYATGCCGSGVVWLRWLGKRVAEKILGSNKFRSAFDFRPPKPIPFFRGTAWFMPAVFAAMKFQDRIADR